MAHRSSSGRIVLIALTPQSPVPLFRQIYEGVRSAILDGRLVRGAPVPSSRALARELQVSRSTVVLAYEHLHAEGYIETRAGGTTRVAVTLPDGALRAAPAAARHANAAPGTARVSRRARAVAGIARWTVIDRPPRPFRAGVPAVDIFPIDIWGRLMNRRWQRAPAASLAYGDPFGYLPLRKAIAGYLGSARGVHCTAEQVMVVNGSQHALDLVSRLLLDPGDEVWLEDPGYHGAHGAFLAADARVVPVPVDADGLDVAAAQALAPNARMAFVTPSRQLPLGVTLSLQRRLELLRWAAQADAWIVEDDYDSEFRYVGRPLAALQGLDTHDRVIYLGTFSKVVAPSLRLGYVVLPPQLLEVAGSNRPYSDFSSPWLTQAVMTDFITDGHFERHIRRMRATYQARQAVLLGLLRSELAGRLDVVAADGGMSLLGWLPEGTDDVALARAAAGFGVDVLPMSRFTIRPYRPGLLMGYAGVWEHEMAEGVAGLAKAFDAVGLERVEPAAAQVARV